MEEIIFMPYDVYGNLITENGQAVNGERYLVYLTTVLPDYYLKTKDFAKYRQALLEREAPRPGSSYGW